MALYAAGTSVPIARSVGEIENILKRYGADSFMYGAKPDRAVVMFTADKKSLRFELPLPRDARDTEDKYQAECRRRWRSLVMGIKAKLEFVASGVATFEEEFLTHIVLPNGQTVAEHVLPSVRLAYETGKVPTMLEWGGK